MVINPMEKIKEEKRSVGMSSETAILNEVLRKSHTAKVIFK